jgi:hypothetical protein
VAVANEGCFSTTTQTKRRGCCNISIARLASTVMERHSFKWVEYIGAAGGEFRDEPILHLTEKQWEEMAPEVCGLLMLMP